MALRRHRRSLSFSSLLASTARAASLTGVIAGLIAGAACTSSSPAPAPPPADAAPPPELGAFAVPPHACAFECSCDQTVDHPYACPSLGPWSAIAHDAACPAWDGSSPTPRAGKCTASAPSGEAAKYAGADPDRPGVTILPDGRRLSPAGKEWRFADLPGGLPSNALAIAGTPWVVTVDDGYGPHAVRVVDPKKIDAGVDPTVSLVRFDDPLTLNDGLAFVAPDRLYVATANGVVQALTLDLATGALARDDAGSPKLPAATGPTGAPIGWYASGVAASPDGKRLVVSGVKSRAVLVLDVQKGSPTFGAVLGSVDVGAGETFAAAFDPHDPTGNTAYVSLWATRAVVELDLSTPSAPKVGRTFATGKDPEGLAFLDARWMAVAADHGDSIALVDRVAGAVTSVPVDAAQPLHGQEPSTLTWDAPSHRLWATLAGANAIAAWDVDLATSPPTLAPAGALPTGWWPGRVAVLADGSLAIVNLRGHGTGAQPKAFGIDDGDIMSNVHGSMQHVPKPTAADLLAGAKTVAANDAVGALAGAPTVTCPDGADDFPIPSTNGAGPSKAIDRVIFVVRENKAFDGVLGDLPGVEGKADLTFVPTAQMDALWKNFRQLVRTFATSDDHYTSAELSIQGHVWTTHGRSNDYVERTWASDGDGRDPRHDPAPDANTLEVAKPDEGSLFDWLGDHAVPYAIFGEAASLPRKKDGAKNPVDADYPGGFVQSIEYPDVEKACYLAGRLRVLCDLPAFSYVTFPNDHTHGVSKSRATPEVMISTNDEATGMLVDAVSHSPFWKSTLIVIVEDDPTQGGDHVDNHRSPMALVSPWVKRGYVSKTHVDISSLHKLFAHVLGLPYPNAIVANASLPLDAFTSTPDFTPYTYAPRQVDAACASWAPAAEQLLTDSWEFQQLDAQRGLEAQVARWLKKTPWTTLPPAAARAIALRNARRAMTVAPLDADD